MTPDPELPRSAVERLTAGMTTALVGGACVGALLGYFVGLYTGGHGATQILGYAGAAVSGLICPVVWLLVRVYRHPRFSIAELLAAVTYLGVLFGLAAGLWRLVSDIL